MKHIHVIVLDDSIVVREGIHSVISRFSFVKHISVTGTPDELEIMMRRSPAHIVVINPVYLQSNLNQIIRLKNQFDQVKWIGILYSHYPGNTLNKLDGTIDIYDSLETITSKFQKWIENSNSDNSTQSKDTLTERETNVLKQLAEGMSNKEIADKLTISINTVITHRKNISQKTGIKSVSGLTIYAVVQNLISLDNF